MGEQRGKMSSVSLSPSGVTLEQRLPCLNRDSKQEWNLDKERRSPVPCKKRVGVELVHRARDSKLLPLQGLNPLFPRRLSMGKGQWNARLYYVDEEAEALLLCRQRGL